MIINELVSQGINAKNKFQLRNKNNFVSVTKKRNMDNKKQNTDIAARRSVMSNLP
jgi:hypothetical protein